MDRTRVYWLLPGMDRRIGFAETVGGTTTFYYYLTDQVGTVLRIVKEDGTVVNQYDYDAFGRVRQASPNTFATVENRYLFQGREWDKNGGFYYFRNRIYLPERGEFATPDMNLGRGILGELDGMATLTFCGGDPVNCIDPTGLDIRAYLNIDKNLPEEILKANNSALSEFLIKGRFEEGSVADRLNRALSPEWDRVTAAPGGFGSTGAKQVIDMAAKTSDAGSVEIWKTEDDDKKHLVGIITFDNEQDVERYKAKQERVGQYISLTSIAFSWSAEGVASSVNKLSSVGKGTSAGGKADIGSRVKKPLEPATGPVVESTLTPAVTGVMATKNLASRILVATEKQLQKKFKHASDFSISGNFNKANAAKFGSAINQHINSPGVKAIQGTYRGKPVIHYINPETGLNVIADQAGNFVSGWKLGAEQLQNVLTRGSL